MANIKISQLPAASAASGTQEFEVNDSGTSKKVTGAQLLSYIDGNHTHTLSEITDAGTAAASDSSDFESAGTSAALATSLSNRNAIINGNFDVWQRGTSGSSNVTFFYVADRWKNYGIGSTNAVSLQTFTIGQTDVPNQPLNFHRSVVTSSAGSSNFAMTQQRIEDVRTFSGQTVTLSFWAKADASKNIAVEFSQDFGSGGSTSVLGIGVQTCNLTTAWQKFTVTATLPSISGKTLGLSNVVDVTFWYDAGSNYNSRSNTLGQQSGTFDLAQVQLEVGSAATPFERRSYGNELSRCQRYYEKSAGDNYQWSGNSTGFGGNTYFNSADFKVTKRAAPTMTSTDAVGNSGKMTVWQSGVQYNNQTTSFETTDVNAFSVRTGGGITDAGLGRCGWTADAEL